MKRINKLGIVVLIVVVLVVMLLVFFHQRYAKQPAVSLIGVALTINDNNALEIQSVAPGTTAAKVGLRPGLVVQQIDGINTADQPLVECLNLTSGPIGSKLHLLVVDTARSETNDVEITREKFIVGAAH